MKKFEWVVQIEDFVDVEIVDTIVAVATVVVALDSGCTAIVVVVQREIAVVAEQIAFP